MIKAYYDAMQDNSEQNTKSLILVHISSRVGQPKSGAMSKREAPRNGKIIHFGGKFIPGPHPNPKYTLQLPLPKSEHLCHSTRTESSFPNGIRNGAIYNHSECFH
ncbi:hypothetical protein AVEN_259356-1 [Araneus ventricosus]|uniref:Uncharacterized protein n=1 Tax=Araneus ventricosus TaxID=182803 RepID=A0A4Y2DRJ9_ARAVE|nr:hypothetical protein AVEN_259356-1 [Araneus ventricosus]